MAYSQIKKVARVIFPAGSRRRIIAGRIKSIIIYRTISGSYHYRKWVKKYEPLTLEAVISDQSVKFSIIVPAHNTPRKYIKQLVESVTAQTYQNWEMYIADGSSDPKLSNNIKRCCETDTRINYLKLGRNHGISGNTNAMLDKVSGDYIAFLDHDDILPSWSLNEVAHAIKKNPTADIFYSDEDRLSTSGKIRMTPLFKPDWSPDLFLSANYTTHLFVIERDLLKRLGKLNSKYDGSQDYDLALRAVELNAVINHIPKILYHMRIAKGSTARSIDEKSYVNTSGRQALEDYFERTNIKAKVFEVKDRPTNYRIKYDIKGNPLASIIIPFKDKADLLKDCVDSIQEKTKYKNFEIILISNQSQESKTKKYLESISNLKNIKILNYDKPFNYSKINNFGRRSAKGSVLIFLNNDTKVLNSEWLEELISVSQRKEIGAAGALLFYPDMTIQHAGVVLGLTGLAGHIFRDIKLGVLTYFWLPDWPRNYLAVTGACLAIETKKFDSVGGFNEDFIMAGSDVVLGLDLYKAGYNNVYWPYAQLIHYESKSVGSYANAPKSDYDLSTKIYMPYLNYKDPFFNPNLSLESEIPEVRENYE